MNTCISMGSGWLDALGRLKKHSDKDRHQIFKALLFLNASFTISHGLPGFHPSSKRNEFLLSLAACKAIPTCCRSAKTKTQHLPGDNLERSLPIQVYHRISHKYMILSLYDIAVCVCVCLCALKCVEFVHHCSSGKALIQEGVRLESKGLRTSGARGSSSKFIDCYSDLVACDCVPLWHEHAII